MQNYTSGLLATNQCERIKKDLLQKQANYNIQPVAECNCQINFHKKLVTGNNDLSFMHTISKTTIIKINYPKLNIEYFIYGNNFSTAESKFKRNLTNPARKTPKIIISEKEQLDDKISEIDHILELKGEFIEHYNNRVFTEEVRTEF